VNVSRMSEFDPHTNCRIATISYNWCGGLIRTDKNLFGGTSVTATLVAVTEVLIKNEFF